MATLIIGGVLVLVFAAGQYQQMRTAELLARRGFRSPAMTSSTIAIGVTVLACIAPAIGLLCAVRPLRSGSRKAPIITLAAAIWIAMGLLLALLGSVVAAIASRQLVGGDLVMGLIFAILFVPASKLIYHNFRIVVMPGRGASEHALVGAAEAISGGLAGQDNLALSVVRLALLRLTTGIITCIIAAILLAFSLLPQPPSPPQPLAVNASTPFPVDLHAPLGLAAPDRLLVAAHFQRYLTLTERQQSLLDSILRESGRVLVRYAYDTQSLVEQPSVPMDITPPLTTELIASRFIYGEAATLKSRQELAARSSAQQTTLHIGGQWWEWNRSRVVVSSRGQDHQRFPSVIVGDICQSWDVYDPMFSSGGAWRWTDQAIERELKRLCSTNSATFLSVAQGETIVRMFSKGVDRPTEDADPRLRIDGTMDVQGSVELQVPTGRIWIDRDGGTHSTSGQERARIASTLVPPRRLPITPSAPAALGAIGMVSIAIAVFMLLSAKRVREGAIPGLRLLSSSQQLGVFLTLLGSITAVWIGSEVLRARPETKNWLWSVHFGVGMLLMVAYVWLAGILAPLKLRRRFESARSGRHPASPAA